MILRVRAGAGYVAGIIYLVARVEGRHLRPDAFNHAGCIPAQYAGWGFDLRLGRTHLRVDWIHGNGLDAHEEVPRLRLGLRQFDIEERFRIGNGQVTGKGDGFHGSIGFRSMAQLRSCLRPCPLL